MKFVALLAVPPGVVTTIGPVVPLLTVTVRLFVLSAVIAAITPPMVTAVALSRFVPLIVTDAPAPALLGENEMMVGGGIKVKLLVLVAVPPGVVTMIGPVAPLPTVTVRAVALSTGEWWPPPRRWLPR